MLFLRKCRQYILHKNYIPVAKQYMDFMQILPHKQTVWTHPSLTQSFNHRANITKQLFCFQLKWKVRPKRSSNSLNSSFLSATSTKQPTSRNLTALHPGKFECSLSGKDLPQTNLIPGFNNTLKVSQSLPSLIETSIFAS